MRERPIFHVVASLLVLVQLGLGPFAHATPLASGDADCAGVASAQVATHGYAAAHEDASVVEGQSGRDDAHHCRAHVTCACPCAHTPALGVTRLVLLGRTSAAAVAGPLAGPAFDAPLFDFLRPPN